MGVHPKIKAATALGALAAAAVAFVQAYGTTLDPRVSSTLTLAAAVLGGYAKTGPVVADPAAQSEADPVDPAVDLTPDQAEAAAKGA